MIQREIVVTIPGHPAPKGSLKCIGGRGGKGHVLVETNKRTQPWRDAIARVITTNVKQRSVKDQPLAVDVTSTLDRPKHHYGTGRNAQIVKTSAPAYPVSQHSGDVDKLARLVLDALQDTGLIPDDCQVVDLVTRKRYVTDDESYDDALPYAGVVIRINPIK